MKSHKSEYGFTLIEIMVVVLIIGILSAIAVPTYLIQRKQAWDSAAELGVRSASLAFQEMLLEHSIPADGKLWPDVQRQFDELKGSGINVVYRSNRGDEWASKWVICTASTEYNNAKIYYVSHSTETIKESKRYHISNQNDATMLSRACGNIMHFEMTS